jgi:hypothetical protein
MDMDLWGIKNKYFASINFHGLMLMARFDGGVVND